MPPKVQTTAVRGRGRPKAAALSEATTVTGALKKRGRAAKDYPTDAPAEPPKKRGRPAKSDARPALAPAASAASARSRHSLPAQTSPTIEAKPAPSKKHAGGRPRKQQQPVGLRDSTGPKRRGRPAKSEPAIDLKRVANVGSPRVAKRSSPRAKRTIQAAPQPVRLNPRLRSKLRTRKPVVDKTKKPEPGPQPAKRRGRPAKTPALVSAPKKIPVPKATKTSKASKSIVPAKAGNSKPAVPRKKRGYTSLEVPDRFVLQLEQLLQDLQEAERLPTPADDDADVDVNDDAGDDHHIDIDVDIGEDIVITSAVAAGDEDEARLITGDEDVEVDDVEVDSAVEQEEVTVSEPELELDTVTGEEDVVDEASDIPAELPTEIDVALSVQEKVQIDQTSAIVETIIQEVNEEVVIDQEQPSGLDSEEIDDMIDSILAGSEAQPTAGVIFS